MSVCFCALVVGGCCEWACLSVQAKGAAIYKSGWDEGVSPLWLPSCRSVPIPITSPRILLLSYSHQEDCHTRALGYI